MGFKKRFCFLTKETSFLEVNEKLEGLHMFFSVLSFSLPELLDFLKHP